MGNLQAYSMRVNSTWAALVVFIGVTLLAGCISTVEENHAEIDLEDPRATAGILIKDPKGDALDRLIVPNCPVRSKSVFRIPSSRMRKRWAHIQNRLTNSNRAKLASE